MRSLAARWRLAVACGEWLTSFAARGHQLDNQRYQYRVTSKWAGWLGGWGSEDDIAKHIETETVGGWHLLRTESEIRFWWFFVPRPKLVFIYERAA